MFYRTKIFGVFLSAAAFFLTAFTDSAVAQDATLSPQITSVTAGAIDPKKIFSFDSSLIANLSPSEYGAGVLSVGNNRFIVVDNANNISLVQPVKGMEVIWSKNVFPNILNPNSEGTINTFSTLEDVGDVAGNNRGAIAVSAPLSTYSVNNQIYPNVGLVTFYDRDTGALLGQRIGRRQEYRLGTSILGVGDITGDGTDDFVLGAPDSHFDPSNNLAALGDGEISLENGGTIVASAGNWGFVTSAAQLPGNQYGQEYGTSLALIGRPDARIPETFIVVGAPKSPYLENYYRRWGTPANRSLWQRVQEVGKVEIVSLRHNRTSYILNRDMGFQGPYPQKVFSGEGELFGHSLAVVPNPQNKKEYYIWVGAPDAYLTSQDPVPTGKVYVLRATFNVNKTPYFSAYTYTTLSGIQPGEQFGWSMENVGDYDKDGWDDVAVVSPKYIRNAPYNTIAGRVRVYSGRTSQLIKEIDYNGNYLPFGSNNVVAAAGDTNGNLVNEIIVGSPFQGTNNTGEAFIYEY